MDPQCIGALLLLAIGLNQASASANRLNYFLKVTTDGPITSGAQATISARLMVRNGSQMHPAQPNAFHFHWKLQHTLSIKWRSEDSSSISVLAPLANIYDLQVWVTHADCWICLPVAIGFATLHVTDSVVGHVSLMQSNSSIDPEAGSYQLATNTSTKISFILYDPSNYFSTASFLYIWRFGDGSKMVTNESYVSYIFHTRGVYHLRVEVLAHLNAFQRKNGVYTATLNLLDPVRAIEITSNQDNRVDHRMDFLLYINGSPPLSLCWLISPDCIPDPGHECHSVSLKRTSHYNLSYTSSEPGPYTLSVRAQNDISAFHTCYTVNTWQTGVHQVWFIIPCIALLTLILIFILSVTIRNSSGQKDLVEVADFDFSPATTKQAAADRAPPRSRDQPWCCFPTADEEDEGEKEDQPLLKPTRPAPPNYTHP
ncbi:transmembrane protein 130 [Callorhinchus milii]|uniref:transmembrane protein 130 n=1 Tax=Callorhinchus milii TaxID=7868 RepID=UPI001C3F99C1|nr:transmembrane protein 130 [Callorhinchus milii]